MRPQGRTAERDLARLASRAHGVVTHEQLLDAGVTVGEIKWRLRTGALLPVHRGIYRVGHRAPSIEATYLAAVWACGDGALLTGTPVTDAGLYHLAGLTRLGAKIELEGGYVVATAKRLHGARVVFEFPSVGATENVMMAAVLAPKDLARACHEAGVKHRTTPRHVTTVLERRPSSPGAARLRSVLLGDTRVTLSDLEARFLELLEAEGLPLPRTNRPAGGRYIDCRWPELRLTVELDSYTYHHSRHAWEQDRRRERAAYARGDDFRRYTRDDVFEDPAPMLTELMAVARPGTPAAPSASPAP